NRSTLSGYSCRPLATTSSNEAGVASVANPWSPVPACMISSWKIKGRPVMQSISRKTVQIRLVHLCHQNHRLAVFKDAIVNYVYKRLLEFHKTPDHATIFYIKHLFGTVPFFQYVVPFHPFRRITYPEI